MVRNRCGVTVLSLKLLGKAIELVNMSHISDRCYNEQPLLRLSEMFFMDFITDESNIVCITYTCIHLLIQLFV